MSGRMRRERHRGGEMRRTSVTVWSGIGVGLLAAAVPALGADATAGKILFRQQCSICHTAEPGDNGGAQGPSLIGVYGRPAAGAAGFSYTGALRAAHLTWDAATLKRFLASPTTVVPGSAMVVSVPNESVSECRSRAFDRPIGDKTPRAAYIASTSPAYPHPLPLPPPATDPSSLRGRPMRRSHYLRDSISSFSRPISKVLARCWSLPTATF